MDDAATFATKALQFSERMTEAKDFNELLQMWRSTSYPYRPKVQDPHSPEYLEEVHALYKTLTSTDYDVQNELTSSKLSDEEFKIGFPWTTKNLSVIWPEMAKVIQTMKELEKRGCQEERIIEFGAGWGNLAIPLAKSGFEVSVIDIDEGFLQRVKDRAAAEHASIKTYQGDFVDAAASLDEKYKVALFQASFHHCLEFEKLLERIRDHVLEDGGFILFGSEPIFEDYPLPWGLRFDGESIWAITDKKWLELGFSEDFFFSLLTRTGFFGRKVDGIPYVMGDGWGADLGRSGIAFADWRTTARYSDTFHAPGAGDTGRFCRARSVLPGLARAFHTSYELQFQNFSPKALTLVLKGSGGPLRVTLQPQETQTILVPAEGELLEIQSETFCPANLKLNNDDRVLGPYLHSVKMV